MKIIDVQSDVFEWERPGIWNGGHFYGPGRLHKVTVKTDEGIEGYGMGRMSRYSGIVEKGACGKPGDMVASWCVRG